MNDAVHADDGCRLWATCSGHGHPLLFCHGGPGLWDMFTDLAATLGDVASVVRWDQRGCGRSERRGGYTVARYLADLDAVRGQLAGARTALLGHSWGATLALRYALQHPDRVSHLIYVSGTGLDPKTTWRSAFGRRPSPAFWLNQHPPAILLTTNSRTRPRLHRPTDLQVHSENPSIWVLRIRSTARSGRGLGRGSRRQHRRAVQPICG
ncbi:alpha/beta fold hydrolase [Natronosporangium hydrolyticum]|uniref:Alpha/beta fold hydrolase n=1 Tax=Natronosporangium hydrolyticum TaxID=2811111 RepID=A0A895Y981_9ACTN|nr:alpha/beta fold hydrolase [Natronosporangium hydrolyticum]QSB14297.1 alpha/beta fold hydrolase [Natronosporangium hydrolyticum]